MEASPPTNYVSLLNQELCPPRWGTMEFPSSKDANDGSPDKPRWRCTLVVRLTGEAEPRTFSSSSPDCREKSKAREDAARRALADADLRAALAALKSSAPVVVGEKMPQNATEALFQLCAKGRIRSEQEYSADDGRYRCTLKLYPINGLAAGIPYMSAPFGSKAIALESVALRALEDLARTEPVARQLLSSLPKGSIDQLHITQAGSPVPLLSPQQRGQPFRGLDGAPLKERRDLEFKALDPGSEKDTPEDFGRILTKYVKMPANLVQNKPLGFYVSAFLNSGISGRIVFGVRNTGEVWGLPLTPADEDQFLLAYDDMLRRFYPSLSMRSGVVKAPVFLPVTDDKVPNLKLIVIETQPPAVPRFPYVYFWHHSVLPAIKGEASATVMTPEELAKRIADGTRAEP